MTCGHFNASYNVCDLRGHIGRPTYTQCPEWTASEEDAKKLYERILGMLKIPASDGAANAIWGAHPTHGDG